MVLFYIEPFVSFQSDIGFSVLNLGFVSYRSRISSSALTLAIFFGKQAFSAVKDSTRGSVLSKSPIIVWT